MGDWVNVLIIVGIGFVLWVAVVILGCLIRSIFR